MEETQSKLIKDLLILDDTYVAQQQSERQQNNLSYKDNKKLDEDSTRDLPNQVQLSNYILSNFSQKRKLQSKMSSHIVDRNENSPKESFSNYYYQNRSSGYSESSPISFTRAIQYQRAQASKYISEEIKIKRKKKQLNLLRQMVTQFLKNNTPIGRSLMLESKQMIRDKINDLSDGILLNRKENLIIQLFRMLKSVLQKANIKALNRIQLFDPLSQNLFYLQTAYTIYNIFFLIYFSLEVVFIQQKIQAKSILIIITILVWLFEAFIKFNTKIYKNFTMVIERHLIIENYIKNSFFFDFFPLTFLIFLPKSGIEKLLSQLVIFLKMKNVLQDKKYIQQRFCISVKNYHKLQLVNLISQIFIIGHILACAWYIIGYIELNFLGYEQTWYDQDVINNDHTWWKLYLQAFNWALTLLTTGSNNVATLLQLFFTTFIMIFTTIVFAYILNIIGIIIQQLEQKDEDKRYDLNVINEYIRNNKISSNTQTRINMDLESYYTNCEKSKEIEGKNIIQKKISPHLQKEIQEELVQQVLNKLNIFVKKFSSQTVRELSNIIKEEYYQMNQVIFKENQQNEISIFLVLQGTIHLTKSFEETDKNQQVVQVIKEGELFGQFNFFSSQPYKLSAISKGFSKVIKLDRQIFKEIIQKQEKDHQIFCQIQDQLNLYQNHFIIDNKCQYCQQISHSNDSCHYLHINQKFIYYKQQFYQKITQSRMSFNRQNEKMNSYKDQRLIEEQAIKFQDKNKIEDFDDEEEDNLSENEEHDVQVEEAPQNNIHEQSPLKLKCPSIQQLFDQQILDQQGQENIKSKLFLQNVEPLQTQKSLKLNRTKSKSRHLYSDQSDMHKLASSKKLLQESIKKLSQRSEREFRHSGKSIKAIELNKKMTRIIENLEEQDLERSKQQTHHTILNQQKFNQSNNTLSMAEMYFSDKGAFNARRNRERKLFYQDEIIWDFDKMVDWKYYFPYNNPKYILMRYYKTRNKYIQRQIHKFRQSISVNIQSHNLH